MHEPFHIVFPVFPGITQLDYCGPAQFLARIPGAQLHAVAAQPGPIATDSGFSILPSCTLDAAPQADLLCVPGGFGVVAALQDEQLISFIARQSASAQWTTSVCTGAFLLGKAGLLNGKRATTHWGYAHLLPMVGAIPTAGRIVEDGTVVTAGGVTSGIDFALLLIMRICGEETARAIQLALEYDPASPLPGGHPDRESPNITAALKRRVYDAAAQAMADALR